LQISERCDRTLNHVFLIRNDGSAGAELFNAGCVQRQYVGNGGIRAAIARGDLSRVTVDRLPERLIPNGPFWNQRRAFVNP